MNYQNLIYKEASLFLYKIITIKTNIQIIEFEVTRMHRGSILSEGFKLTCGQQPPRPTLSLLLRISPGPSKVVAPSGGVVTWGGH